MTQHNKWYYLCNTHDLSENVLLTTYYHFNAAVSILAINNNKDKRKTHGLGCDSNAEAHKLQDDLNTLFNWSQDWQMKFNVDKCKVMHLGERICTAHIA